jgi:hypothetical protein
VKHPRYNALTSAVLACDQNVRIRWCHLFDDSLYLLHGGRQGHKVGDWILGIAQHQVLGLEAFFALKRGAQLDLSSYDR